VVARSHAAAPRGARIHSDAGWIARAGQFPSPERTEFPLAAEAARYYRNGPPFMQRYLPFWLANVIDRMWVALFSIIAILIPVSRVVPPLYRLRIRRRVYRWYRNLRRIEDQAADGSVPAKDLLADLDKLDARAAHVALPLAYTEELYALRQHIGLVRARLHQR
jgi:hypothetical protein